MIIRLGRYISPIDIEAQLSPENNVYTHSIMYKYDPYTFTGLQFITQLRRNLTYIMGVQAGNDMAPWTAGAQPNGVFLLKWVSERGNDSIFGGVDSIGKGYYSHGHDDLQVIALTWGHRFTDRFHTITESYYIWERNARVGGTVTYGPPEPYFGGMAPDRGFRASPTRSASSTIRHTRHRRSRTSSHGATVSTTRGVTVRAFLGRTSNTRSGSTTTSHGGLSAVPKPASNTPRGRRPSITGP
jgi:hypothetical protein